MGNLLDQGLSRWPRLCPCPVPGLLYDNRWRSARLSSSLRPLLHNSGGCGRLGTIGCPFEGHAACVSMPAGAETPHFHIHGGWCHDGRTMVQVVAGHRGGVGCGGRPLLGGRWPIAPRGEGPGVGFGRGVGDRRVHVGPRLVGADALRDRHEDPGVRRLPSGPPERQRGRQARSGPPLPMGPEARRVQQPAAGRRLDRVDGRFAPEESRVARSDGSPAWSPSRRFNPNRPA